MGALIMASIVQVIHEYFFLFYTVHDSIDIIDNIDCFSFLSSTEMPMLRLECDSADRKSDESLHEVRLCAPEGPS